MDSALRPVLLWENFVQCLPTSFVLRRRIMAFIKGAPRAAGSGMQKGQTTKRAATTQETFQKIVEKYGDPLVALAEMAFDPKIDLNIRNSSLKEIVKYGYAQRRAVEITGKEGGALEIDARLVLIQQISGAIEKLGSK